MMPLVRSAMKTSSTLSRKARKAELEANAQANKKLSRSKPPETSKEPGSEKHEGHPKEFSRTISSAPRRLNDVVSAPPVLKALPRGVSDGKQKSSAGKRDGILSMAQKVMMETEREKAILHYREMKERKREAGLDKDLSSGS
jgi:hypothetical protein